jgi:DHA3 family macrolide efflux protein-like MFS transporter
MTETSQLSSPPPDGAPSDWATLFFTIWIGQAISLVGSRVGGFALVWWLTRETGSATVLAMASFVALLPNVFLGPIVGALVDRWNRRRVMVVADSVIALLSAWLAFLFWTDALQIWHVYVIMFVRALGGTFHFPAMQASTSLMVPKAQLARVSGMNQTLQGVMSIVTPPLGAFLMEALPLHTIMAIDVLTAAFAIAPLFFIKIPQPPRSAEDGQAGRGLKPSLWQDVKGGFAYIWHWRGMFIVLLSAMVLNFLVGPGMSLLPILVTKTFNGGALQLGWLNSAWGIGVVAGGLTLSAWGGFKRKIVTALMGFVGMSVGFLIVGLAPDTAFWLVWGGLLCAGFMNPITNGPFFAILQDVVAPEMQGRVFTVVMSATAAAMPLGMAIAGPVVDWLGVQVWFILSGVAGLLVGLSFPFLPDVMHLEDHRDTRGMNALRTEGEIPA